MSGDEVDALEPTGAMIDAAARVLWAVVGRPEPWDEIYGWARTSVCTDARDALRAALAVAPTENAEAVARVRALLGVAYTTNAVPKAEIIAALSAADETPVSEWTTENGPYWSHDGPCAAAVSATLVRRAVVAERDEARATVARVRALCDEADTAEPLAGGLLTAAEVRAALPEPTP